MATTGLHGPHALITQTIDTVVIGIGAGAYALGRHTTAGTYYVDYVGRSDSDLNGRLKQWAAEAKYPHFKYGFLDSAQNAFYYECRLYHDFGGPSGQLHNDVHPARPKGTSWKCPHCGA